MAKILDTQAYLDTVCDLLREGHTHVPVTVAGTSMTPPFSTPAIRSTWTCPSGPSRREM